MRKSRVLLAGVAVAAAGVATSAFTAGNDFDQATSVVGYGETGRAKLTTLTREFFMPGFLERDEGEREGPYDRAPWDGVSGVRPYRGFASTTTVGVY